MPHKVQQTCYAKCCAYAALAVLQLVAAACLLVPLFVCLFVLKLVDCGAWPRLQAEAGKTINSNTLNLWHFLCP